MVTSEYKIEKREKETVLRFRKQDRDLSRFFPDFNEPDPLDAAVLQALTERAVSRLYKALRIVGMSLSDEIALTFTDADDAGLEAFCAAFLDELETFYEANELHVTRMFGSFILLKRENGRLRAKRATPVPIRYCPLMRQLLKEVGGETAETLLSSVENGEAASQSGLMCRLIDEVVIGGGYFDTDRPLNSCEANVLFGASETMSTAFRSGLLDAAVIVSNNLGTIITTNEANTQGAVKRMTGLFMTSPSKKIVRTAEDAGIIPVFPHTAVIDQLEGVRLAIALGYKKIAVSTAWMGNSILGDISGLERDGVMLYKFGLCSTGIDEKAAEAMEKNADLVWACASKVVREHIAPNSVAQVGVKIPVHIMTEKGWRLVQNHLELTSRDRTGEHVSYGGVVCKRGEERPVILNDGGMFTVIKAKELAECADCPHPCI
jgi:putative methanogenesis marker protein 8